MCVYVSLLFFFFFFFTIDSIVQSTIHSLLCLSSLLHNKNKYSVSPGLSGAFDDWIILFGYAGQFKTVFPLSRKYISLFIYVPTLPLWFYQSHVARIVLNKNNRSKTTTPGDKKCEGTLDSLHNIHRHTYTAFLAQPLPAPDVNKSSQSSMIVMRTL